MKEEIFMIDLLSVLSLIGSILIGIYVSESKKAKKLECIQKIIIIHTQKWIK